MHIHPSTLTGASWNYQDFSFGVVNEDDVDGVMGKIAVPENSGTVSGGDLLCTLFHRVSEAKPSEEVPTSDNVLGHSANLIAPTESLGSAFVGNDHSSPLGGERAIDEAQNTAPATMPERDGMGYPDDMSTSTIDSVASDWPASTGTPTPEPASNGHSVAPSFQEPPVDPSFDEPIPILVPPMGKSKGTCYSFEGNLRHFRTSILLFFRTGL